MNERERVLLLLSGGTPDQVPWFGDLSYWYYPALANGQIDKRYESDGIYDLHRDLGVGFYLQGYFPFHERPDDTIKISHERDGNTTVTRWETPVGAVSQVDIFLPESYTSAIKKHIVGSLKELEIYAYIIEHTRYEPHYDEAIRRQSLIGDNGVALCYLPRSPYMNLVAEKAGIENVVDMMLEDDERFAELLGRITVKATEAAEIALCSPAECLMLPENISSEVVGKKPFERFMRDWHVNWNARISAAGKTSFVHLDGTMRGLITELSAAGVRVLEALTPGPVGDMEIEELSQYVRDDTILWGGIPGLYFTDLVSDAQFDEHVKRVLDTMTSASRYVLGVADQVPPGSRPARIARVRELVDQYGRYQ